MDETQSQNSGYNWDAWTAAHLGRAIDVAIDRQISRPAVIVDPSQAYGMDENGNLYQLGQYSQATATSGRKVSPMLVLGAVILLVMLAKD